MVHRPQMPLWEALGLTPLGAAWRQGKLALAGDAFTPKSRFDLTSLRTLFPIAALGTWAGFRTRRVLITNFFNHTPTPVAAGWSVGTHQVKDYRGKSRTYDSHNGTDFSVPVGTAVVAAAPGIVRRVSSEFHRGGRKVVLDHGDGLLTSYNHLAAPLVRVGAQVARGEVIALSGYSGLDGLLTFPFGIPHVHFNVWLNGVAVDPFARPGEVSLWRVPNDPRPWAGGAADGEQRAPQFGDFDFAAVRRSIAACVDPDLREMLEHIEDSVDQALALIHHRHTTPTRFPVVAALYRSAHPRTPRLDLPFRAADWDDTLAVDRGEWAFWHALGQAAGRTGSWRR